MLNKKISNPRLLLAKLRKGDYAHPGESEAIDLVLNKIHDLSQKQQSLAKKTVLDVGCGLGGTAEYIRSRASYNMYGIDIDESSILHAKKHYPDIKFFCCDVKDIQKLFTKNWFDIIYMFNVFYAFPAQKESLQRLAEIAKPEAILSIFDYTQNDKARLELNDFADKPMNLIYLNDLTSWLAETGWNLIEITDISAKYKDWYAIFLKNLRDNKASLLAEFTADVIDKVDYTFSLLLKKIQDKQIGGSIIYAKRD